MFENSTYRYLQEKERRLKTEGTLGVRALLAQELAIISGKLVIADLPVLSHEGTHLEEETNPQKEKEEISVILPELDAVSTLIDQEAEFQAVDQHLSRLEKKYEKEIEENFDTEKIKERDPATIVRLINFLIQKEFTYANEVNDYFDYKRENLSAEDIDLAKYIDTFSVSRLLETKRGVCRHLTKVATGLFESFKRRPDSSGKLDNTKLYQVALKSDIGLSWSRTFETLSVSFL